MSPSMYQNPAHTFLDNFHGIPKLLSNLDFSTDILFEKLL